MLVTTAETANEIWVKTVGLFLDPTTFTPQGSRNGTTREILRYGFTLNNPRERWILSRTPPLNIAFALAEIVWMVRGRKDSKFLNFWNNALPKYAGDCQEYHGAYGFRLRRHLGIDQLDLAYETLLNNRDSRQAVLQIWDSRIDLPKVGGKPNSEDIPCNIVSFLKIRNDKLDWTQVMRSNDIYRGLPYNIIQFTSLQEVLAGWLDIEVGSYNHFSDSLHVYEDDVEQIKHLKSCQAITNSDTLSLDKRSSDEVFETLEGYVVTLIDKTITKEQLSTILLNRSLPVSYNNILVVFCAESARRRGWHEFSDEIISSCGNRLFVEIWRMWATHLKSKRKLRTISARECS